MKPFCAVVEWGTSSFRIWLLSSQGNSMIERRTDEGIRNISDTGFRELLDNYLENFSAEPDLPVVICGMAGARNGWREAGYINLPIQVDRILENSVIVPHKSREIRILPGIAQRHMLEPDVMRGEETVLFGLSEQLPEDALVCIPGAHSKWARFNQGKIEELKTFLTGEMFSMLTNHSVLSENLSSGGDLNPANHSFVRSVREAYEHPQNASNQLFRIHASNLLGYSASTTNIAAISGTLIGLELSGMRDRLETGGNVVLVASGALSPLYKTALQALRVGTITYDEEQAVLYGLYKAACFFWRDRLESDLTDPVQPGNDFYST